MNDLTAALQKEIQELSGQEYRILLTVAFVAGGGISVHLEAAGSTPRPLSKELTARIVLSAASRFLPKEELDKITVTDTSRLSS